MTKSANDKNTPARGSVSILALTTLMMFSAACSQATEPEASQTTVPSQVAEASVEEVEPVTVAELVTPEIGNTEDDTIAAETPAYETAKTSTETTEHVATATAETVSTVSAPQGVEVSVPASEPIIETPVVKAPAVAAIQQATAETTASVAQAAEVAVAKPAAQTEATIQEASLPSAAESTPQEPTEAAPAAATETASAIIGDADAGKRAFAACRSCHTVQEGRNGLGPSLAGVFGREAGTVEGFKYSDAMTASGVTWTAESLDKYLLNSEEFIPGNRMTPLFRQGVQKDDKRRDIIAYLETQ
ncbi:MAG: c-type cytochrome [Hyphomonadaceae bacterium]